MESISKSMKGLHHAMMRKMDEISKDWKITGVQFFVLKFLHESKGDVCQKDIENHMKVKGSTVTVILDKLCEKGFIKRESSKDDARKKLLILQGKSIEVIKHCEKEMRVFQEAIDGCVTAEEMKVFAQVVEKIKNKLEEKGESK